MLLEITNVLVSELDIRELFPSITACLRRVMPSEYSSLALLEPGGGVLKNYALVFEGNPAIIPQGATARAGGNTRGPGGGNTASGSAGRSRTSAASDHPWRSGWRARDSSRFAVFL